MTLLPLYARQEPTTDRLAQSAGLKKRDTVFYKDAACRQFYARWRWDVSGRPTARATVTLNCYRWRIVWVTRADVSVTRHATDGFTLSAIVAGQLVHRRYIGWTLRAAMRDFLAEVQS